VTFNTMHYSDIDTEPDWRSDKCDRLTKEYLEKVTKESINWNYKPSELELRRIARHMAIDATYD
jgi:hypothetical protein